MQQRDQILNQLSTIVKPEQISAWDDIETPWQRQLLRGMVADSTPAGVVYPRTQAELAELITCAHQENWRVLPCGRGSKLHWGGLASGVDVVVSTERLAQVIDHAVGDLTVTVEAGCSFSALQKTLAPSKQQLAIDPSYGDRATIGGVVATADTGFLRQRYGGVRDRVIGISVVRADGQLTKAGGQVVKNVAGYDLMKLFTGSWGSLGIISQLTLRLYPVAETAKTVCLSGSGTAIQTVAAQLFASSLTPTAFAVVLPPTMATLMPILPIAHRNIPAPPPQSNWLTLVVRFQSIDVSVDQQSEQLIQWGKGNGLIGEVLDGATELALWQQLGAQRSQAPSPSVVTCKLGVLPAQAVPMLEWLNHHYPPTHGWINGGSGLGWLYGDAEDLSIAAVEKIRQRCQSFNGFLSVLAAPSPWKQTLDLWGYQGQALGLMQRLKHQFDPQHQLSPGRFIPGL
ncbi:MAG: FAD-binding oxidoreductase [Leptolyngbyaceae bacterium]|nr:FAD-binding oxidoreductase [Leptolyngbyaceae bacterium]